MKTLFAPNYITHFQNAEDDRYGWGRTETYPSELNIFSVLTRHLGNDSFNIGSIHNPIFQLLQLWNIETKEYNFQCCGLVPLNESMYYECWYVNLGFVINAGYGSLSPTSHSNSVAMATPSNQNVKAIHSFRKLPSQLLISRRCISYPVWFSMWSSAWRSDSANRGTFSIASEEPFMNKDARQRFRNLRVFQRTGDENTSWVCARWEFGAFRKKLRM